MTPDITYNNIGLTPTELAVVKLLRRRTVATKQSLCCSLGISHMTLFRALRKSGYFTSFNANASHYTLAQTPQFDALGLWFHRQIGFSKHGPLPDTIVALVEQSAQGYGAAEMEGLLHTPTANLLCRLVQTERISSIHFGRHARYVSIDSRRKAEQEKACRQALEQPPPGPNLLALPEGSEPIPVIALLSQIIRTPGASPKNLQRKLRGAGVPLSLHQIQTVMEFYQLKKKRRPPRRHSDH
jgi:hypothetical protein